MSGILEEKAPPAMIHCIEMFWMIAAQLENDKPHLYGTWRKLSINYKSLIVVLCFSDYYVILKKLLLFITVIFCYFLATPGEKDRKCLGWMNSWCSNNAAICHASHHLIYNLDCEDYYTNNLANIFPCMQNLWCIIQYL